VNTWGGHVGFVTSRSPVVAAFDPGSVPTTINPVPVGDAAAKVTPTVATSAGSARSTPPVASASIGCGTFVLYLDRFTA
jgi:hypothetical protein